MKKFILSLTVLLIFANSFGQKDTRPPLTKDDYLKRAKTYKITGHVLLFGGAGIFSLGAFFTNYYVEKDASENKVYASAIAMPFGLLCMITSVPMYIISHHNKKKSAAITFNCQNIYVPQLNNIAIKPLPAITLKIGL